MWRNKLNERNKQMANIIFDEAEKQKIRFAAHYQASSDTMRGVKKDLSYLISITNPTCAKASSSKSTAKKS